ncbi:hypothetical protein AB1K83_12280 [Sporosarcina sp. 179-K 3D1 HS]|uniref:hypothetical protein n=1 Tax=Sporosarcina sp. 179-K 3D1 HS TaxID=3232169 RepID=UPI0039A39E2D
MKLIHWAYTRKYQIKAVFDTFPTTVVLFRKISDYYFIFSMSGVDETLLPTRKDYVRMEYLLNKELGTLQAYKRRKRRRTTAQ